MKRENIVSHELGPDEILNQKTISDALNKLLDICLQQREKQILEYRFGFSDKPMTLTAIGKIFNVCGNRIRTIENKAIRKLGKACSHASYRLCYKLAKELADII